MNPLKTNITVDIYIGNKVSLGRMQFMEAETLEGSNKLRSRFSNEGLEIEFCLNKQEKNVIIFHSLAFKSVAGHFTSIR